jgi:hypothetical protein
VKGALNQKNAAAWLDISVPHFVNHVRPEVQKVYIGGATRYPVTGLQAWLDKHSL